MNFTGKIIVITGSLKPLERVNVVDLITKKGGIVQNYVSSQTEVLIVGHKQLTLFDSDYYSKKYEKAQELIATGQQITIIGEEEFFSLIQKSR